MPCLGHCPLWLLANEPSWMSHVANGRCPLYVLLTGQGFHVSKTSTPVVSVANGPAFDWLMYVHKWCMCLATVIAYVS